MTGKGDGAALGGGDRGIFLLLFAAGILPLLGALWSIFFDLYLFSERGGAIRRYFDEAIAPIGDRCCSEARRRQLERDIANLFGGSAAVLASDGQVSLAYRGEVPLRLAGLVGLSVVLPLNVRASVGIAPVLFNVAVDLSGDNAIALGAAEFFSGEYQRLFVPRADGLTLTSRCFGEPLFSRKRAAIALLQEFGTRQYIKTGLAVFPGIGGSVEWIADNSIRQADAGKANMPRYGDEIINNQLCAAASTGSYALPDGEGSRSLTDLVERESWDFRRDRLAKLSAAEALWVQASRSHWDGQLHETQSGALMQLAYDTALLARGARRGISPLLVVLSSHLPWSDPHEFSEGSWRLRWYTQLDRIRAALVPGYSAAERTPLKVIYVLTARRGAYVTSSLLEQAQTLFQQSSNELLSFSLLPVESFDAVPATVLHVLRPYLHRRVILR